MQVTKLVIVALCLSALGVHTALAQQSSATIKLTESDNNKPIDATIGQGIEIRLQANPTTRYEWLLQAFTGSLELEEFSYTRTGKQMAGSGGIQAINFVAKSSGSADVKVEYRRPWDRNTAPARIFTVKVTVR